MTDTILKKVSEEERLQNLRESREMMRMQISWEKQNAREKGLAEGRAEGRTAQKQEMIRQFYAVGIPIEKIIEATGLTKEEIESML